MIPLLEPLELESLWVALKWAYVIGFSLYAAFSVVVMAQVKQMISAFKGPFDAAIKLIAIVHVFVALGALLLAIVVL
jgi:hypothetical protein